MIVDFLRSHSEVQVVINRIVETQLLWRSANSQNLHVSDEEFLDAHSWIIKDGFFKTQSQILSGLTVAHAERYGGLGVSTNGGGARVVNVHGVQLKGVGANLLAGRDTPHSHSYGGLDIQGAAKEIIYSSILNAISPVGAQHIYGLILLDRVSAVHEGLPSPSVILVREKCLRMGQLLPCLDFRPKSDSAKAITADYYRMLALYKQIGLRFGVSSLYIILQDFLDKAADQLTFMKFAKISHNALIPSNISMDGRLLDTSTCSFVLSGSNFGQLTSVMEEPEIPIRVASEILYLIKKFSGREDASIHFSKLYREKYKQYIFINAGFVLAIDRHMAIRLSSHSAWQRFAHKFHSVLVAGCAEKTHTMPTVDGRDLANDMLVGSLFSVLHSREIPHGSQFLRNMASDLNSIIETCYAAFEGHFPSPTEFRTVIVLQMLKRAFLSSFYFITYIGRTIDDRGADGDVNGILDAINVCEEACKWIFESVDSDICTIYADEHIVIYLSFEDQLIYRKGSNDTSERIGGFSELSKLLVNAEYAYVVLGYDFLPFMKRLCAFFSQDTTDTFDGVKNVFSRS